MTQNKTALMLTCLLATALIWNLVPTGMNAGAQPPKVKQKWEYATLTHDVNGAWQGESVTWIAGKKVFHADWGKDQPHPYAKLNKELGGDGDNAQATALGVLLDRIGQDGWELASHVRMRPDAVGHLKVQIWTFKRPG